jgi:hypothetical protein
MKKEMRRKLCALLSSYIVLFNSFILLKNNNDDEVVYNDNYYLFCSDPFAYYKDKEIYIGYRYNVNDKDNIYIVDGRYLRDSNMKVVNSYRINDTKDMENIIKVICEYEDMYPTRWDRTPESMKYEWIIHNFCYLFDIEPHRSGDVDFNNADENKYLILNKK